MESELPQGIEWHGDTSGLMAGGSPPPCPFGDVEIWDVRKDGTWVKVRVPTVPDDRLSAELLR